MPQTSTISAVSGETLALLAPCIRVSDSHSQINVGLPVVLIPIQICVKWAFIDKDRAVLLS